MDRYLVRSMIRKVGLDVSFVKPDADLGFFLNHLCRDQGINCVIDVGANVGQFGNRLRFNGYTGHIFSFEPVSTLYAQLEERSRPDPKWFSFPFALGSTEEAKPINVIQDGELSSFLGASSYGRSLFDSNFDTVRTEEVRVHRLDTLFDDLVSKVPNPRVLLKTDTQGWDLEVLKGAEGCIDRVRAIASEVSLQPIYETMVPMMEYIPYLQSLGFEVSALFPVRRDDDNLLVECDCVMVRPAKQAARRTMASTAT